MVEALRLAPLRVAEARRSGRWRREYAALNEAIGCLGDVALAFA